MEEAIGVEDEAQQNLASTAVPRDDKVSTNCFDALLSSFLELKVPFQPNTTTKPFVRHPIRTNCPLSIAIRVTSNLRKCST